MGNDKTTSVTATQKIEPWSLGTCFPSAMGFLIPKAHRNLGESHSSLAPLPGPLCCSFFEVNVQETNIRIARKCTMKFRWCISYNMETLNQLFFSLARITSESQKLAYPEGKQVSLRIRRSRSHSEICIMGSTCYVCPEDTLSKDGLNLRGRA